MIDYFTSSALLYTINRVSRSHHLILCNQMIRGDSVSEQNSVFYTLVRMKPLAIAGSKNKQNINHLAPTKTKTILSPPRPRGSPKQNEKPLPEAAEGGSVALTPMRSASASASAGEAALPSMAAATSIALCHLAFLLLLLAPLRADRVFTPSTGTMFGHSSREPKYKIEFHSVESPFHPYDGQESMTMSNKDGKKYLCLLPMIEETKSKPVTHGNNNSMLVGTEQPTKLKTPDELLDVLKDLCPIRHEGWWTYEFCYHKMIRQLHLEDDKTLQEFVLGQYDSDATLKHNQNNSDSSTLKDPRFKDASQRYHAQIYTNGTICDLTNQPRETEIRFVCSDSPTMISSIKEVSTCKYVVTVQCSMLCKHPLFQQEKPAWHTIHCNEIQEEDGASVLDSSVARRISFATEDGEHHAT